MQYTITVTLLVLVLACAIIGSAESKSGSSSNTKWTSYNDPYGRYAIEYPSKWKIQNEPVHVIGNEIAFQVSDFHNGIARKSISVQQIENAAGMDGREVLSTFQGTLSNYYLSIQPAAPITCIYITYNTCMLGLVATTDGQSYSPIAAVSIIDPQEGTFILTYTDYSSSPSIDFNHVIASFTMLGNTNSVLDSTIQVPFS